METALYIKHLVLYKDWIKHSTSNTHHLYLEYDLFGTVMLNYPFNQEVDMASDNQEVKMWITLVS